MTTFPVYTIESAPEPSKPALQQLQSAFVRISAPVARWNCCAAACTVASATTTDNEGVTTSRSSRADSRDLPPVARQTGSPHALHRPGLCANRPKPAASGRDAAPSDVD